MLLILSKLLLNWGLSRKQIIMTIICKEILIRLEYFYCPNGVMKKKIKNNRENKKK